MDDDDDGWDHEWQLVSRRVARIGVLRLWFDPRESQWWVTLDNRTYHHAHGPIAPDKLPIWKRELGTRSRCT